MDTLERFSAVNAITDDFGRYAPSVAAADFGIVMVHREAGTDKLVYNMYDSWNSNSGWGFPRAISEGLGGDAQQHTPINPTIATYGGQVHMIYRDTSTYGIRWSYFDAHGWAPSTELPSRAMSGGATLAALPSKLVMTHTSSNGTPAIYYASFH